MTSEQLIFQFAETVQYAADHFLTADCNRDAHRWVTTTTAWPDHTLILSGPARSGKTHLAHIWAAERDARIASAKDLTHANVPEFAQTDVVIEGVDNGIDQTALFHLYNLSREQSHHLLLTARTSPAAWAFGLPDLQSRIAAAPVVAIGHPDEALVAPLLVKLCADRQLHIPPDVIRYLAPRLERSFEVIEKTVSALDHAAVRHGRRVTLPLARSVLETRLE